MLLRKLGGFILAVFVSLQSYAQSDSSTALTLGQQGQNHKKNKWLKPVLAASSYAGATWLVYSKLDTKIQDVFQSNHGKVGNFVSKSVSDLGLGKTQTIGLASTTALAFLLKDQKLKKTVIIWSGSLLLNSVVTQEMKMTFKRHRPRSGHGYNAFDWRSGSKENNSFPSAHTSNIFTTATVFATCYKDVKWVPAAAYSIATLVGLSRIYDNAHWASDVLVGAAIGFGSAKAVNALYKWAGKKILFLPQVSRSQASISFVCRL